MERFNLKSYDVVIVGAGPGGLRCAEELAGSPLKVLLLEQNAEIGPKVCAGGLTGKGMDYLNLPDEMIEYKFNKVKMQVNSIPFTVKHAENFAYTIDRKEFGQWHLKKLQDAANVEVRTGAKAKILSRSVIRIDEEEIEYKILVGADGSNSTVRKFLQLKSEKTVVAFHYVIPGNTYKSFELYFQPRKFHAGYAWIFPHKNYASIGTGGDPKHFSPARLRKNLIEWIQKRNIDISAAKYESFMINCDYRGYKFDNIYLVGDAAGMASMITGEGIYQALISGEEVGKEIRDPEYTPDFRRIIRNQNYLQRIYNLSNQWGKFRVILYYAAVVLLKFSLRWRRRFIDLVG